MRLEVFEKSSYWRMLKINWVDGITNEEVLDIIIEKRTLWRNLRKKRSQMIGHTLRHGELIAEGCFEG